MMPFDRRPAPDPRAYLSLAVLLTLLGQPACKQRPTATPAQLKVAQGQPESVVLQHILIAFEGSSMKDRATRDYVQAIDVAAKLYIRARGGEDFDALVKAHTDDAYPGIYRLTNYGVETGSDQVNRKTMVKAFGDVGFGLKVGGIGRTSFHLKHSPSGFHIIKRLK